MKPSDTANLDLLKSLARRAMLERGLLPEFSAAALSQRDAVTAPAEATSADIRDLRTLPWGSIDNDDSRDLDQLSAAQPLGGGAVKILVAIADVDAIVTGAAPKGTWARIFAPTAEGRVVKGFAGLEVGDPCRVKLIHTDVARGFIDFERVH